MKTAIVHHPVFREHDTGPGHPETASRYSVVMKALKADAQLWGRLLETEARKAPRGEIQACHAPQLYKAVERAVSEGVGFLMRIPSSQCARWMPLCTEAGRLPAIDMVMKGEAANAFVPVRPPGHHATPNDR